jgi:formylglycine-generating enzyme required for sulfatase activity
MSIGTPKGRMAMTCCVLMVSAGLDSRAGHPQRSVGIPGPASRLRIEFVTVPAGAFMMGCSAGDDQCDSDEEPRHRVTMPGAFELGKYEAG